MTGRAWAIGVWTVLVTGFLQFGGWLFDQVPATLSLPRPPSWVWTMVCVVNAALVYGPARLLWLRGTTAAERMAGRAWATAAGALTVLGLARLVPLPHDELALGAQALVTGAVALAIRLYLGWARPAGRPTGLVVAIGVLCLLPWPLLGALGGRLETAMAVAAGIAAGALARAVLDGRFWVAYGSRRLVAGTVAGIALAVLAAGIGAFGVNLLEFLVLPPLGYAAARVHHSWLMVGLAGTGPLAFVDPQELAVLLGTSDILTYAALAALCSLTVALVLGLLPWRFPRSQWLRAGLALALLLGGVAGYVNLGHPGFYGNRLFVVLRSQADLGDLAGIADPDARAAAVYRRLVDHAQRSQVALREDLRKRKVKYTAYYLVNAIEAEGGPVLRALLAARSDVERVLLSQRLRPLPDRPSPQRGDLPKPAGPPWNITAIGADRVWRDLGVTGAGVLVGHTDTGVDGTHPVLRDGYRGGGDSWYDPWNHSRTPRDVDGHGTATAALAVGRDGIGVAPGAQWIGCANTARNMASPARHLDCLQFMLAPFARRGDPFLDGRPDRGARILTNSWTCTIVEGCDADALLPAMRAFQTAGVYFVVAAGNGGPFCRTVNEPPATYPEVTTVGATNSRGQVARYSSRGPVSGTGVVKPDLVAPGTDVVSARPGDSYSTDLGTSMSAPEVAGVVALLWSANPKLVGDLAATRKILVDTARPVAPATGSREVFNRGRCGAENTAGAGMVDAYAAVTAARAGR